MKRTFTLIAAAAIALGMQAQAIYKDTKYHAPIKVEKKWKDYNPGDVEFHDEAPESEGSRIYHSIIPNPVPYIQENALRVLQTLYYGPKDSNVPRLKRIVYTIKDYNGISEKYGSGDYVGIRYSTNWIERCFAGNDTLRLDYETRGVLYHELTHAYQLSPEGCGSYDNKSEYWIFIEGLADAVRVACGCFDQDFSSKDRTRGDSWRKGYRVTGYFLYWLSLNKDKDFIRKFNRSAAELKPWSWDKAMKHILGDKPENSVDALWDEYQKTIGDK